jgi:hypothetical protein
MILKTLKSNKLSTLFFVPIAVFAFWLGKLLAPVNYDFAPGEAENVLFSPVFTMLGQNAFANVLASAIVVIVLSLLMHLVNERYHFIRIRTKLPAIVFPVILGGFVELHTMHPAYFGAMFLLMAIFRFLSLFEAPRSYSIIFDAGILLSIGVLFYFNLLVFIPAFMIGIYIIKRTIGWRDFIVLLLGCALPFLFAFSYFFLTDKLNDILLVIQQNINEPINHFADNLYLQIYLGVLVFFTLLGSLSMAQQYDSKKVSSRKFFSFFFLIFIFSMLSFVFVPATSQEMLIIASVPVTFLISNFLVFMKSRFWSEFFFWVLLGIVVTMQLLA